MIMVEKNEVGDVELVIQEGRTSVSVRLIGRVIALFAGAGSRYP